MSPVQQTADEMVTVNAVLRWVEIARREYYDEVYGPNWWPGSVDALKSSLLRRLLDGKEPLEHPPPRAHSYPWYELVEQGSAQLPDSFVEGPYDLDGRTFIYISQCAWTVHASEGAGRWIVSYREGDERWLLRRLTGNDERQDCGCRVVAGGTEPVPCDWLLERLPARETNAAVGERKPR